MQRYRSRNQDECVRPRGCPGSQSTVPASDPSLGRVVVEPDHSGASKCPQDPGRWSRRLVRLQVPLLDAQSCACKLRVRVEGSQRRWPAISSENGGDPRHWLQQGQGSRKGWRRTVGPCTSSGMSRMLCPRRDGGSVELRMMKATFVAKRQCTGSAGTRRAARTGGGDDDAGGTDNQKPASRARQYVQGGCKQINGDAAHL